MDEEENGLMEQNQQQQQQQSGSGKSSQDVQQTAQKVAEHVSKKAAGKSSLMAPIAHFVMMALPFIIIAIILIGILVFLLTMPGMVMEQLKALFTRAGNAVAAFFGADTTEQFEESEIYDTLDYLEQMGYDLKGFGFLTDYVSDTDDGVARDEDGKISEAKSDFISTYMVSDNYVYTLKNKNVVTRSGHESWLGTLVKGWLTARAKVYNFFCGPIFDFFGVTDATMETLGRGLIMLYYDDGTIGQQGNAVNTDSLWNWDDVKIDVKAKTLEIARNELFNSNKPLKFSLDGWTGRYGMPLEFLLSVHVATMMPDLAFDMATSFPTNINIYLHRTEKSETGEDGSAIVAYKTDSGYVTAEELNTAVTGFAGKNWLSSIISSIDNAMLTADEANTAIQMGIVPPGHNPGSCGCKVEVTKVAQNDLGGYSIVYEEVPEPASGTNTTSNTTTNTTSGSAPSYYYLKYKQGATSLADFEKVYVTSYETRETLTEVGDECKKYIKKVISLMMENNDYDYKAYIPYIANVVNHWYRDVYFVAEDNLMANNENLASNGFVDYDYDYEALTKERWTLYKTHEDGEQKGQFILYFIDDSGKYTKNQSYVNSIKDKDGNSIDSSKIGTDSDGYYYYTGTSGEAIENQIPVSKMAVKIDGNEDTYTDLGWTKIGNKWTAYEENNDGSGGEYERLYPDEEIADDEDKEVKEKLYVDVNLFGTVKQKGEGLRTETNTLIKKMFLQNKYFKYDGTAQTAEVITALRKDNNIKYGALSEADLEKTTSITSMDSEGHQSTAQYKVSDYAGKVSLEQDSLNAFSMLENTHTLDADYIYRDFKELIIELGYYEKEELTDDTPRKLLQWIVPQIASGGFPNRSIDKDENEYGTMIHSKGDIEANQAMILKKLSQLAEEAGGPENPPEPTDETQSPQALVSPKKELLLDGSKNILGQVASLSNTPIANLRNVGAIKDIGPSTYTYNKVTNNPSGGTKVADLDFNGVQYECWWQTSDTCTLYSFAFVASAYTDTTFEEYVKEQPPYWCPGLSGSAFQTAGVEGTKYGGSGSALPSVEEQGTLISEALDEGKPIFFYSGFQSSAGQHAVVLLGSNDAGKVLYYNPWGGVIEEFGSSSIFSNNLSELLTSGVNQKGGHLYHFFIPAEPPAGVKRSGGSNPYTGFEGNEAVVSPVTGILLDYGTYTEESGDRVNVDMKKANEAAQADTQTLTDPTQQTQPTTETQTDANEVKDLVGFAKILVLDSDNYKKLEAYTNSSWKNNSLVSVQTTNDMNGEEKVIVRYSDDDNLKTEEDLEDWSELDKTIYGYKEFAEAYEAGGISGNIVYIDGFKAELPDEEFNSEDSEESGDETATPSGEPLTIDNFKETTEGNINSEPTEGEEEEGGITSLYEKDEVHKMASQKATDKLKATASVKEQASPTMYVSAGGDDLIFIKEGTVIGRTLTDRELIVDYRHDDYEKYRKSEPASEEGSTETGTGAEEGEENLDAVIGNYLRIIFQDQDSVVENVEDYMKIDDGTGSSHAEVEWEFYYWLPYESGGIGELSPGTRTGAAACGTVSGPDEIAVGFAQWTCKRNESWNNIPPLCEWLANQDSSLCGSLATFSSWSNAQCCDNLSTLQTAWWAVYDADPEKFMELQMQYFYEEQFKNWLEADGTQWLESKSLVAQGTYASLKNWGPYLESDGKGWKDVINESMSDEEICKALLTHACNFTSTVGSLNDRWNSQFVLAKDILDNTFTEVEEWIKTKQPSDKYGEGKNPGVLAYVYINNYRMAFNFIDRVLGLI